MLAPHAGDARTAAVFSWVEREEGGSGTCASKVTPVRLIGSTLGGTGFVVSSVLSYIGAVYLV